LGGGEEWEAQLSGRLTGGLKRKVPDVNLKSRDELHKNEGRKEGKKTLIKGRPAIICGKRVTNERGGESSKSLVKYNPAVLRAGRKREGHALPGLKSRKTTF